MNREILFRGKTEPDGHWVYGSLISRRVFSGRLHWITYQELVDKKNELWLDCEARVRVKSETVGQYTGLKDKNGVKIFEGDICRAAVYKDPVALRKSMMINSLVVFRNGAFALDGHKRLPDGFRTFPTFDDCEVIGNRWDNPELLEMLGDD